MILRDYKCGVCEEFFEIASNSVKDNIPVTCPGCGEDSLGVVYLSAPLIIFKDDPKTIGSMSDRNIQKMGTYEYQSKVMEQKEKRAAAIQARKERGLKDVAGKATLDTGPKKNPIWRDSAPDLSLATLSTEKQTKYIMTGEK
jgi:hypothetical protein